MKGGLKLLAAVLIVGLGFGSMVFLITPKGFLMGYDRAVQEDFDSIAVGMEKSEVVDLLGKPRDTLSEFPFSWLSGPDSHLSEKKRELCVEYLLWGNGGNWFYCIGFDTKGRVIEKAEGHS